MSRQSKLKLDAVLHSEAAGAALEYETVPAILDAKGAAALRFPCASTPHGLFES
jgi:hypothetical protein